MALRFSMFVGGAMAPLLPDVARLCTIVFREWPHLYEGDGRYDPDHLRALAASSRSVLIMAYDGDMPVGASTGLPLADATGNVQAPFLARGWSLAPFFYFAESVLLPCYRGRGSVQPSSPCERPTHTWSPAAILPAFAQYNAWTIIHPD